MSLGFKNLKTWFLKPNSTQPSLTYITLD